jgi:hypothetical protein
MLRGEDALSFIETYVRDSHKSGRLNSALMNKLWKMNRDPNMMLKFLAGVPLIYYEDGLGELFEGIASILEDVAIFVKVNPSI